MTPSEPAWVCTVCGYVHRGPEPPDVCPVCGAPADEFEPYEDPAAAPQPEAATQWQCLDCNYVHDGDTPPETCPVCGAPSDRFVPLKDPQGAAPAAADVPARIVVLGAGIAGVSAVESARKAAPDAEILLVAEEEILPYYRLNLTRYLAGDIDATQLPIHSRSWYADHTITLRLATEVADLDVDGHTLQTRGGDEIGYERLVVAMGSHPFVPPVPGTQLDGVMTLRTTQDADRILTAARSGASCVCIGGGILGIETAGALARQGADVTLLESHAWLMPRQLNAAAAGLLKQHVETMGVRLLEKSRSREIAGDDRVRAVILENEEEIPADIVVLATGVRPNTHLARRAGLEVDRGIVVDNHLRTSHPDVFAAGDVAEHNGTLYGAWGASQFQGTIAGMNAAGQSAAFGGLARANSLKLLGMDLTSLGQFEPEDGSFIEIDETEAGRYLHFVFHDNRLVGAILIGEPAAAAAVKNAIENRTDCSGLLRQSPGARDVLDFLSRAPSG